MKKLIVFAAFLLISAFASAGQKHAAITGKAVLFVLAVNPDPEIGTIFAPTLEVAEQEIEALAQLDPACFAAPQVCEARAAQTVYTIFYVDGTTSIR